MSKLITADDFLDERRKPMIKRLPTSATPSQRFERMYQPVPFSGCWLWIGGLSSDGYGSFSVQRRHIKAHKFAYLERFGEVPAGLELDHLCRIRCCVNPDHLEPVTHRENVARGNSVSALNASKTHCPRGHSYSIATRGIMRRVCLICEREANRRCYARRFQRQAKQS